MTGNGFATFSLVMAEEVLLLLLNEDITAILEL